MKLTRVNSNSSTVYWPDDLPPPFTSTGTIEIRYLQCGCTIQETSVDTLSAFYGDVVSWSPAPSTRQNGTSGSPRSPSPTPSDGSRSRSIDIPVARRVVDPGFCEKSTCGRSKVFNREWNRLWNEHNSEMKQALDDQVAFEAFKAKIRRAAAQVTEGILGRMPEGTA